MKEIMLLFIAAALVDLTLAVNRIADILEAMQ